LIHTVYVVTAVSLVLPLQLALIRSLKAADNFMIWNLTTNVRELTFSCC